MTDCSYTEAKLIIVSLVLFGLLILVGKNTPHVSLDTLPEGEYTVEGSVSPSVGTTKMVLVVTDREGRAHIITLNQPVDYHPGSTLRVEGPRSENTVTLVK